MSRTIATGKIRKYRYKPLQVSEIPSFNMKFLESSDLRDICGLQGLVAENLPSQELFRLHDEDYFRELLESDRSAIGITIDDVLIAYSLIVIPGAGQDNLGNDIDLPEDELESVAHLQAAAVHPDYRGNGLQKLMGEAHLKVIEEMGFANVLCTVSPRNPVSLRNILDNGFVIKGLRPKFWGVWRYIMYRDLHRPTSLRHLRSNPLAIKCSDIEGQLDLLQRGYLGFDIDMCSGDFEVLYGRIAL